ncbi:MAG TPA: sigma factor, partial [Candidatus Nitrosotenuis sp.]|nr:sigma factor [Candidatus Nitrosotenuis sp.]
MGEKTAVDVAFLPAALEAVHSSARETRRQGLEHLVRRLQDGDPAALEPFIRETQGVAWRLAYSYLQDRHCCEDALQEVYLAVYRHIGQLRDPRAVHTWLCRIVANRCRRLLRRRRADSLEELAENGVAPAV